MHGLCQSYVAEAQAFGASFAYHTEVVGLAPRGDGYQVDTRRGDARFSVRAGAVVNAAGLASDRVAAMAGVDVDALLWFLERRGWPAALIDFTKTHAADLDHLYFDVGLDFEPDLSPNSDGVRATKTSFYGTL